MSTMNGTKKRRVQNTWSISSSCMAKRCVNPIRRIVDTMKVTPNPDKDLIALSIGDPTIFGNLPLVDEIEQAVVEKLKGGHCNGYGKSFGVDEARQAVAKYENKHGCGPVTENDIVLANGCSAALEICILVLANPGQNILVPRPGFSLYKTLSDASDIHVKHYDLRPDQDWEVDLTHMESLIDDDTAAILVNNPSNPCGSVYSVKHIRQIVALAEKYKLPIIADEIYAHVVFPGETYCSIASQSETVPVLSCSGLTKRFIVPGWRMGWIVVHDRHGVFSKEVRSGLTSLTTRIMGPNSLIQHALPDILEKTPQSFFDTCLKIYKENADICFNTLCQIPGLKPIMPKGAMYMLVGIDIDNFPSIKNDVEFTEKLVSEQSVFCLPAVCFQYPNYFRIVLTMPPEKVEEAMNRLKEFCSQHHK